VQVRTSAPTLVHARAALEYVQGDGSRRGVRAPPVTQPHGWPSCRAGCAEPLLSRNADMRAAFSKVSKDCKVPCPMT